MRERARPHPTDHRHHHDEDRAAASNTRSTHTRYPIERVFGVKPESEHMFEPFPGPCYGRDASQGV
jgi:hypothetical protein